MLVFQSSGQIFKNGETKTKAVSQDTLKLIPVKTVNELDSLEAKITHRMSIIIGRMPNDKIISPGIYESVPMDKGDLRQTILLNDFRAVIDFMRKNKMSEAKNELRSTEKKMMPAEKNDEIYLKLKTLLMD